MTLRVITTIVIRPHVEGTMENAVFVTRIILAVLRGPTLHFVARFAQGSLPVQRISNATNVWGIIARRLSLVVKYASRLGNVKSIRSALRA